MQSHFDANISQDGFLFCLKKSMIIHKLSEILGMGGVALLWFVTGSMKKNKPNEGARHG